MFEPPKEVILGGGWMVSAFLWLAPKTGKPPHNSSSRFGKEAREDQMAWSAGKRAAKGHPPKM